MKDVVCGMEVQDEKFVSMKNGKRYLFCSGACKAAFDSSPDKFLGN